LSAVEREADARLTRVHVALLTISMRIRSHTEATFNAQVVLVFDLTGLRIDVHSRAFDDVTSVKGMIEERLALGPVDDGR
jgi:hypothetical protein